MGWFRSLPQPQLKPYRGGGRKNNNKLSNKLKAMIRRNSPISLCITSSHDLGKYDHMTSANIWSHDLGKYDHMTSENMITWPRQIWSRPQQIRSYDSLPLNDLRLQLFPMHHPHNIQNSRNVRHHNSILHRFLNTNRHIFQCIPEVSVQHWALIGKHWISKTYFPNRA